MYIVVCIFIFIFIFIIIFIFIFIFILMCICICTYRYIIWLVMKTVSLANDLWISGQVLLQHAFTLRSQSCLRHSQVSRGVSGSTDPRFHNSGGSVSFCRKSVWCDLLGTFLSSCRLLETLNLMANIADCEHHNVSRESIPQSSVPVN